MITHNGSTITKHVFLHSRFWSGFRIIWHNMHLKQLEMRAIVHHLLQFKTCLKKVSMNCVSKFNSNLRNVMWNYVCLPLFWLLVCLSVELPPHQCSLKTILIIVGQDVWDVLYQKYNIQIEKLVTLFIIALKNSWDSQVCIANKRDAAFAYLCD